MNMKNMKPSLRRFVLLIVIMTIGMGGAVAQSSLFAYHKEMVPNFKKIKKYTTNPNNQYYYPKLLQRFVDGDTTLTFEECHYLYYGNMFTPDYFGYRHSFLLDTADQVFKQITDSMPAEEVTKVLEQALALSIQGIQDDPIDPKCYLYAVTLLDKLGRFDEAAVYNSHLRSIVFTILKSGDGHSTKKAWYANTVSDEYVLLNLIGFDVAGQALIYDKKEAYDKMMVIDEDGYQSELYFNVSRIMKSFSSKF